MTRITQPVLVEPASKAEQCPTYTVSTWDHEIEGWEPRDRQATKWDLRRWLRRIYAESWDHVSILIQRNDQ